MEYAMLYHKSTMPADALGPFLYQLERVNTASMEKQGARVICKNKTLIETWK